MKLRIVYMYENGGTGFLEQLLSAGSVADLLNKAENVSQISQYDRDMLKKYEQLLEEIKQQEQKAEEEKAKAPKFTGGTGAPAGDGGKKFVPPKIF
jgi:peptidoglycan hydrolase CwlO-like protein